VEVEAAETRRRFTVEARSAVGLAALRSAADGAAVSLRGFGLRLRAVDPDGGEIAAGSLDAERADALADAAVEIGAARLDARASADPIPAGLDFSADFRAPRFDPAAGPFAIGRL